MSVKPTYEELEHRIQELEIAESKSTKEVEVLRENEAKYRLLVDNANESILVAQDGFFVFANPKALELFGCSKDEFTVRPLTDFIHEDHKELVKSRHESRLKGENLPEKYSFKIIDKFKNVKWVELKVALFSWKGKPATLCFFTDITKQKQAEKELKRSEQFLNTTGKMAKVGGWELTADTLEVSWTDEAYRIHEVPLGCKPPLDEAINFFHPDDRPKLERAIKSALENGEPYDMEARFITAKGKPLWTHTICNPIVEGGKTIKLIGTFQDITERKQSDEQIKESEERFRHLAESSIVGVNIIQGGILKYVNLKFADIFGYSVGECLNNMPYQQLVHPEDIETVEKKIRKRLSGETESLHYTFRGVKKSSETIHVEIFGSSIQFKGKPATFATILDITERIIVEREREKLIFDLKTTLRKVKQLSGLLPLCSHCKKIRDDQGYWNQIDAYIDEHSEADISHSICPICAEKYYPEMGLYDDE